MKIKESIVKTLENKGDLSVKEMVDVLDVSKQAIHIALNQLLEEEIVEKLGRTPKTIYRLKTLKSVPVQDFGGIDISKLDFLNQHFLLISEVGKMLVGIEGFARWCNQRNLPIEKTLDEFLKTKIKYEAYYLPFPTPKA